MTTLIKMPTQASELWGYQKQIYEATGAPPSLVPYLESIMREDIFHSTLDWQTKRQFNAAARKAYRMYQEDIVFYEADRATRTTSWEAARAEAAWRECEKAGDPAKAAEAEQAYQQAWEAHLKAVDELRALL